MTAVTPRSTRRARRTAAISSTVVLVTLAGGLIAEPATAAPPPSLVAPNSVSNSCHISGCAAAVSAYDGWAQRGFPTRRGWYSWSGGKCSYAGGEYYNYDGQLPAGDTFWEYDVYPRTCGAHRDAYRVVVDSVTGQAWYSPDHYADFYEIA